MRFSMSGLSLIEQFASLQDPRQSWKVLFPLEEVLLLVLCGTLAGRRTSLRSGAGGTCTRIFCAVCCP